MFWGKTDLYSVQFQGPYDIFNSIIHSVKKKLPFLQCLSIMSLSPWKSNCITTRFQKCAERQREEPRKETCDTFHGEDFTLKQQWGERLSAAATPPAVAALSGRREKWEREMETEGSTGREEQRACTPEAPWACCLAQRYHGAADVSSHRCSKRSAICKLDTSANASLCAFTQAVIASYGSQISNKSSREIL